MISVDEALARVLALANPPQAETLPLADAAGRVLLQPAVARLTQPPFDAAAMDGYALRAADLPGPLRVIGEAAAGHSWAGQPAPGTAIRIFTGAPVPAGYDRVVMQENCTRDGDQVTVTDPSGGANIRARGGDFAQGQTVEAPRLLRAADIGLLAAMNVPQVTVARRPRVAVIASGDELVRPGATVEAGQIVNSNDLIVAALARDAGAVADILPIARDTEASLRDVFALAADADLIVTIGGASVGDHDLVGKVAADLGLERSFYKLAMRPGKPLMAGRMGGAAMLGLPGNPVSSYVCAILFMQPLIRTMQGLPAQPQTLRARLTCDLPPEGPRQHYLRARLTPGDDLPGITPFEDQDSARLSVLADASALLVRPANDPARQTGEVADYLPLGAG
ncbi:MAG: molybdopterin molybdotransferase MoeA [Paracoccus sp. (in: a-proteobacteria)]|uniref:molybdopterin molybdotransferase MoeA n=1 Tax=Paracoccus sp. TaxID=267 RepID=UPI0026DEF92F|nr:gephyrin-like molybdotransferase Glp [Paracoccus sp. (in: a-proteobacteria)]MDO5612086.1 molybdopterin molybdotransferase MoeA [Paracoccus sp. (in: a-proteobacteria)]